MPLHQAAPNPLPAPAAVVRAAIEAARARDAEALVALFSEDCQLRMPQGVLRGHDGVRAIVPPPASQLPYLAGTVEEVDDGNVLVPLAMVVDVGNHSLEVRATAIWEVVAGLVASIRGVPGGPASALLELGISPSPEVKPSDGAVRTVWNGAGWANESRGEVLERHLGKREAIAAGRRLARDLGAEHVIEKRDGTVAMVEGRRGVRPNNLWRP